MLQANNRNYISQSTRRSSLTRITRKNYSTSRDVSQQLATFLVTVHVLSNGAQAQRRVCGSVVLQISVHLSIYAKLLSPSLNSL